VTVEQSEAVGPWTVKGMPLETRAEINRAAKRADMNVGEWLEAAAMRAIQAERNQGLPVPAPADEPGHTEGHPGAYLPAGSLAVVVGLSEVLQRLTPEDRSLGRQVRSVMRKHLLALRLPVLPRPPTSSRALTHDGMPGAAQG
jgi:hypothetical protein